MSSSMPTPVPSVIQTQDTFLLRQVITQTITYADYTTTALVTLGPGDPTMAPDTTPRSTQSSADLTSTDIRIILGSILGAVVLGLLLWLGYVIRRRMREAEDSEDDDRIIATYDIQSPQPTYWPRFPASIPPPAQPTYRARPRPRMYTAYGAARPTLPTYYDDRR